MSEISIHQLKQHIKNNSKESLIAEITELFKKFPAVQEYYQSRLIKGGSRELQEKYKDIIKDEFFPDNDIYGKMRLSVARKAISDFKKLCSDPLLTLDMMIYYVELGVEFTNDLGDINEPFYNSMESMYKAAAEFAHKNGVVGDYRERFKKIVDDTSGIGWGFHDYLGELYYSYFFS